MGVGRFRWVARLVLPLLAVPSPRCQRPEPDAAACGRCHTAIHSEWQDSAHARAFTDPRFQRALAQRTRPDLCLPCHVPEAVLDRLGQLPRARQDRREEGIGCAACHLRKDEVHGPFGAATAAHPSVADPAFLRRGSVSLCISCHDLRIVDVLPLGREFLAAGLLDQGETCVGCHMESETRALAKDPATGADLGPPRPGRSHRLLGPGDADFCATAFLLRIEATPTGATLIVGNGAGHGVPGLARHRSFVLWRSWVGADGTARHEDRVSISWQNRLAAEEERRMPLLPVEGAIALRIQVDHIFAGQTLATVLDRTLELP